MLDVRDIPAEQAARAFAGLSRLDPRGMTTERDLLPMCQQSRCVQLSTPRGVVTLALVQRAGVCWIEAAAGGDPAGTLTPEIDAALSDLGAKSIAFQTARRGLVKRAEQLGYRVTGYIMRRDLCES